LGNRPIIWKPPAGLPHINTVMGIADGSVSDFDFGPCDGRHNISVVQKMTPLRAIGDGTLSSHAGGDGGKKNAWSLIDLIDVVVDHHSHDG
jgi:hypothetical protein